MIEPPTVKDFYPAKPSPPSHSVFEYTPLVLISGQEPDTLLLYRTVLEMWRYRVIETKNPEELLNTIEKTRPDAVLMDLTIFFADGIKILSRIREKFALASLPIILLSGHAQPEYYRTAISSGADDYLLKPISFETLEKSLKKIFLNRRAVNLPAGEVL